METLSKHTKGLFKGYYVLSDDWNRKTIGDRIYILNGRSHEDRGFRPGQRMGNPPAVVGEKDGKDVFISLEKEVIKQAEKLKEEEED